MSLTVKRNHAKPPAGGHRYVRDGISVSGETVEEVIKKIEEYRAENALPLGDPEKDLAEYYQMIAPYLVQEVREMGEARFVSIEIAEAIMRFWRNHPELYPESNAIVALREATCEKCPWRSKFIVDEMSARPYVQKAVRRSALLCANREFEKAGRCRWCKLPVELICRVEKPGQLEGLPSAPKECWVQSP